MIAVIDNYDSFTWNLVDLLRRNYDQVEVFRNDTLLASELLALQPKGIVISPGPGRPTESGISKEVLSLAAARIPILGICLGHQLIGEYFGMKLSHGAAPVHGKTYAVRHSGAGILAGVQDPFQAMRYHSLVLDSDPLPPEIEITATTLSGEVMAIRHRSLPIEGLQFHPESILTEYGDWMIANWVRVVLAVE